MKKEHLRLLGDKQFSEIGRVKFNYGFPGDDDTTVDPEKNYYPMALGLSQNLESFNEAINFKYKNRDTSIKIPINVDFISITFFDQFNIEKYYNSYYSKLGLEGVSFHNFGRTVLFAIIDIDKFNVFINDLNQFIKFGLEENPNIKYERYVLYIKEFKLLSSSNIIRFNRDELGKVSAIETISLPLDLPIEEALLSSLEKYFNDNEIIYSIDKSNNKIELIDITFEQVEIIAKNFDIIESITCSSSSIVRPSSFNIVQRAYGFEIANANEDLPLIGIIDTGISMDTPLEPITLKDTSFTLNGNPLIDVAGVGITKYGHGTSVAGLAALGRENHFNNFQGTVNADAKLLSIKLSDSGVSYYCEKDILDMLYAVKEKYPELKIFVLATCYNKHKLDNENYSSYTYSLDKFAHLTDSLIFICTGNNGNAINDNSDYDLAYFNSELTNLSTPSDSMNNMTVGAAADGLYQGNFAGISDGKEFPTLFSRKSHIDLTSIYPKGKSNKNLFKPDIIECAGDFGFYDPNNIDYMDASAMGVLSANPSNAILKETGTSLSAPLSANIAAKLLRLYPNINSQTIKALIINGASLYNIRFPEPLSHLVKKTAGNGFINLENTLFSNENAVTLILEDTINNEEQKIYPINFPSYLTVDDLGKKRGILKITATLCFSFEPIKNNQLSYCPIHMAFSIFRNHNSDQINATNNELNSKLNSTLSWSQNGRHKAKPIPYSNSQKIEINVNLAHLEDEDSTFNLAVQARLTSQLLQPEITNYPKEFPFSLVLRIEETLRVPTSKLYDELKLINHIETIAEAEAEGNIEI